MQAIQKYKLMRHKYYNFEIEPPVYKPASDYEFTCEYCDNNKIREKAQTRCSNCGASYKENFGIIGTRREDRLEKRH